MRGVDQAGLAAAGVHGGHDRTQLAVGAADGHVRRIGRVGQRSQDVEHARDAERGANRANKAHGRVEGAGERKGDAYLVADLPDRLGLQIHRQAEILEHVAAPHFEEAARLPCLTIFTPAAAAATEPIVDSSRWRSRHRRFRRCRWSHRTR